MHSHHSTVGNIGIEPTPFNISGTGDAANTLEIYCFFEIQLWVVSRELGQEIEALPRSSSRLKEIGSAVRATENRKPGWPSSQTH